MKISIIQFSPKIADKEENLKKISELVNKCSGDVILLPELATTGYAYPNTNSLLPYAEDFSKENETLTLFAELSKNKKALIVCGVAEIDNGLYNSSIAVCPDGIKTIYKKLHLFGREKKIFLKGNTPPQIFTWKDAKISLLICFDWLFQEIFRLLALDGVELILHSANLVLPWSQMSMKSRALTNGLFIATSNRIGTEREGTDELNFTGYSQIVSPIGEIISKLGKEEGIIEVDIDIKESQNKNIGKGNNRFLDRREDIYMLQWKKKVDYSWNSLITFAKNVQQKAYAPYSNFKVGAAILDSNNNVYTGCNVENASYGLSICAERSAISNMISYTGFHSKNNIKKIVIYSDNGVFPCGACRQVIYEHGKNAEIMIVDINGKEGKWNIQELLPKSFSKEDLV